MMLSRYDVGPFGVKNSGSLENPRTSLSNPDAWLLEAVGGGRTEAGVSVNSKSSIGYPPFWRGINLIASDVGRLPLAVYRRTGENNKERDSKHPAFRLLARKANRYLSAGTFRRTSQYHVLLRGNTYSAIFRKRNGEPEDLLPLSPTETYTVQENSLLWYVTKIGDEWRKLRAEDVLHIKGLSWDGITGHDVLSVMKEALGLGMGAREFGARYFGQGTNISGVLMVPGHFKKEQIENAIGSWEKMAGGLKKSHKVALLQDGVKFEPTQHSLEQNQYNEIRQFEIREVANILGIPPHKLGDSSRTSYNSLEQENMSYLQEGLDHWLRAWEEECWDKLLAEREKEQDTHVIEFTRAALTRTDFKSEVEALAAQVTNGLRTLDEARAVQNLPPYPDGLGAKPYFPLNMQRLGDPKPEPPKTAPAQQKPDDKAINNALRRTLRSAAQRMSCRIAIQARNAAKSTATFGDWLGSLTTDSAPLARQVRDAFSDALAVWSVVRCFNADELASELASMLYHTIHAELNESYSTCTPEAFPADVERRLTEFEATFPDTIATTISYEGGSICPITVST